MANTYISQIALSHPWNSGFARQIGKDGEFAFGLTPKSRRDSHPSAAGWVLGVARETRQSPKARVEFFGLRLCHFYLRVPTSTSENKPSCCLSCLMSLIFLAIPAR